MANRQYKDSVFRMFMNNPVELAKFYQAIRPDTIIRPEDIQINTLEDIMLDQLKHEIMQSFLERCKEEVLQMMTLQWDAEEARRVQEEEYQEELSAATAKSKAIPFGILSSRTSAHPDGCAVFMSGNLSQRLLQLLRQHDHIPIPRLHECGENLLLHLRLSRRGRYKDDVSVAICLRIIQSSNRHILQTYWVFIQTVYENPPDRNSLTLQEIEQSARHASCTI